MLIKFTDCRLAVNGTLIEKDLWIDSKKGVIVDPQKCFYDLRAKPDRIVRLGGKIIAPGFIDVQINGAMGMDFSVFSDNDSYAKGTKLVNKTLVKYGVTAYCPTLTSQHADVYKHVFLLAKTQLIVGFTSPSSPPDPKSAGRIRSTRCTCRRSVPSPWKARNPLSLRVPHCLYQRLQRC